MGSIKYLHTVFVLIGEGVNQFFDFRCPKYNLENIRKSDFHRKDGDNIWEVGLLGTSEVKEKRDCRGPNENERPRRSFIIPRNDRLDSKSSLE